MVLKFWCSHCARPCYIERRIHTEEEAEEARKNLQCPFKKKEHDIQEVK